MGVGQNPTVVQDSLIVMNRLYAKEKLIVDQQGRFKQDLQVDGSARIYTDLRVDHDVRFDGTSRLNGNVHMMNLTLEHDINDSTELIMRTPDGQLRTITTRDFIRLVYRIGSQTPDCLTLPTNGIPCGTYPVWVSDLNKLYTGVCPVFCGIKTDNPLYELDVRGTSYSFNFLAGNSGATTAALYNGFSKNTSQDLIQLGVKIGTSAQTVRFKITNSGTVMMYNNGGHSLIAYDDAGDKILQLENSGVLRSREVRVNEDAWPDYVFDKNYKLPKLTDVAKFIKKNNHLPGVPTAQEIKNDGLNLGDMQTIQMQKIEELTLYLIEMDEKINAMEKRMDELEKENQKLKNR